MAYKSLDSKVHGDNMGPTWFLSALDGPHVGPMSFAIWENKVSVPTYKLFDEMDLK